MALKTNVPIKFNGKIIGVGETLPQDLLDHLGDEAISHHLASGKYSNTEEKPKTSSKKKAVKKKTDEE